MAKFDQLSTWRKVICQAGHQLILILLNVEHQMINRKDGSNHRFTIPKTSARLITSSACEVINLVCAVALIKFNFLWYFAHKLIVGDGGA